MANKLDGQKGAFVSSLVRNSKTIKEDRAMAIFKNAEKHYRRQIEDVQSNIETMEAEREALLDMSPTNSQSLVLASDFNPNDFYDNDKKLTLSIREQKIVLAELQGRYQYLFGSVVATTVTETASN